MRRSITIFFFVLGILTAQAQPFAIGTRTITFNDASRSRDIACTIHYPAEVAGNNTPTMMGEFPVLVHGHGFVMGVDAYTNLRDGFVPRGYILVLPSTEGGLSPDHAAFGLDLAFLVGAMQAEGADAGSPFYQHVAPATAIMGHSMGGGASYLAAANNADIQALVNFAPAETDPSAITAAAQVLVPTLTFAATEDCVTPAATNQSPMYAAVPVACKAFVNVVGGGHCYFGANSFTCSFGEITCGPDLTINREEQHAVMNDFAGLWLDHFLKDDASALNAFRDSTLLSTRVIAEHTCLTTAVAEQEEATLSVWPVPADDLLRLEGVPNGARIMVYNTQGQRVAFRPLTTNVLDVSGLPNGAYFIQTSVGTSRSVQRFAVMRR